MSTTIADLFPTDPDLMPVEVFVGMNGDIVLLQEVPSIHFGERFLRVMVRPNRIRDLIDAFEVIARKVGEQ